MQKTQDFYLLKHEIEFKSISFAFIYLNDPHRILHHATLCLKHRIFLMRDFTSLILIRSELFSRVSRFLMKILFLIPVTLR
jgi:hypothetical protein